MYDLDSLVSDGVVRVAASRFPVQVVLDSQGVSPARFAMAQIPGPDGPSDPADPSSWVAIVWVGSQTGGTPPVTVAEQVQRITTFTTSSIQLVLNTGQLLVVTPARGCGCGSVLRAYRGWPSARLVGVPTPPVTVTV
jgi:hypothetical protein